MISGAEREVARLQAAVEEAHVERARLWSQLHDQRALQRENEDLRRALRRMQNTASWRLTRPLRVAKRVSGELRRRLERD